MNKKYYPRVGMLWTAARVLKNEPTLPDKAMVRKWFPDPKAVINDEVLAIVLDMIQILNNYGELPPIEQEK